ncbi:hypothetical protein LNV23_07785 [Paucibacter sp. DJ1R-11]|uniref:hypothetical protein n=1 Tax=Paucibacter sp. DJ1R-11 TaxID=2893556 RepID=UPI0021E42CD1|nr:hypothetical protein [Paucibacter sp. DJ1R-11]MCV2363348.1 hypothetical protein [Paucibacter sp. DJ1R-11]
MLARACLVTSFSVLLAACSELGAGTGQISQRIGDITRDPTAHEVDLAKLTSFGWNRVYHFEPGSTREAICDFIAAGRSVCGRIIRYPAVPADHQALVFALGPQLTHVELHAMAHGRLELKQEAGGLPRSHAKFNIRRISLGTAQEKIALEPQ